MTRGYQGTGVPGQGERLRILAATPIFPNRLEPHSAPFNRQQLAALGTMAEVSVVSPVPWFPGGRLLSRWSRAGRLAELPRRDTLAGLEVMHPRRPYLPRAGGVAGIANGPLAMLGYGPAFRAHSARTDVVLATWAYPDGWAAIVLAKMLGLPVVLKLHGSDMNVIAETPGPRTALRAALPLADAVVAVSGALADKAISLGARPERTAVVRNGVDRRRFSLATRDSGVALRARARLGLPNSARVVLFIGRLERRKGLAELLEAWDHVAAGDPDAYLVLVGRGELSQQCEALQSRLGSRVRLPGVVPHEDIPLYLHASDILCLPSWSEGVPNVVLEALACGRRVVATDVGGIGEVVSRDNGTLVPARRAMALAGALRAEMGSDYDAERVGATAPPDWYTSARELYGVLRRACAGGRPAASSPMQEAA